MNSWRRSICSYCGVGCGVEARRDRMGRVELRGDDAYPVNRGLLCSKGLNLHHVVNDKSDRLLYPEMRWSRDGERVRVSWETAMQRAAAVFGSIIQRHGSDAVAFYVSGQMLTEEYYVANKLVKGFLGTNNIDTNSRLCMSSAVTGYKLALGDDCVPGSYEDIEACQCFLIAGANPAFCHPILFRRLEKHKAENPEVKIIVVDPRRTQSCTQADLHLQIDPGTDVILFHALARWLIERDAIDPKFIAEHTEGYDALRERVMDLPLAESARVCGVPVEDICLAARWIAESPTLMTMWAMGLNQSAHGVEKNLALLNLSLITGKIGKPGCGPFSLTGQPNAMGGREVGGLATLLAAHRDLANPAHREEVATFWGSPQAISAQPGLTGSKMFDALEAGTLKAVWVICTNPAVSMPNLDRVERALRKARFIVVQDISRTSDTVPFADLLLPAAGWLEKQGTMTNSERRIGYLSKLIEPPGEALADTEILCRFARAMGFGETFDYRDESEVFAEHARLSRGTAIDMSGLSYERLQREGSMQWPCPAPGHAGTPRLFGDGRFLTPSRRAILSPVPYDVNRSGGPTPEFPYILTNGRLRDQWHTMTRTGKVARLMQQEPTPFVEMHPEDAQRENLHTGETVLITSPQGEARLPVRITDEVKPGVLFVPMHWGRQLQNGAGRANALTSTRLDPRSQQPDFKFTAVAAHKIERAPQRIVIVGTGAAALQFIKTYRETNTQDELLVFGREPLMFYNRVLLIEYISARRTWDELLVSDEEELERLNATCFFGRTITSIDRAGKTISDSLGERHAYDKLVLATGSRAHVLPGAPTHLKGVFSIRSRQDADAIRAELTPESHVVIIGGGLLGLEMAGELATVGIGATVIQNQPTLMAQQLDATAATMLRDILEERGVEVILNDQVATYRGKERIGGVRTRGGRSIDCDVLILATGVRPNIELAVQAGLEHNRGVCVDDHLRTSDLDIYAVGEIAEHRGFLYGTTPSANDQARVAAAHASGNAWEHYRGSVLFNILKVHGMEVSSVGNVHVPEHAPDYEEIALLDRAQNYYKKCVIRDGRLVGAIFIGDRTEFADFKELIATGMELNGRREELLRTSISAERTPIVGPLVCSCHGVGRGNLEELIAQGCDDIDTLCARSRAGTGCGSCRPELKALLAAAAAQAPPLEAAV